MKYEQRIQEVMDACRRMNDPENIFWIVPEVTGDFLYVSALAVGAKRILEIGTSIGYSGLFFASALKKGIENSLAEMGVQASSEANFLSNPSTLFTIDSHVGRSEIAKRHFEEAGLSAYVHQIDGHAPECIPYTHPVTREDMTGTFDIVFLDATKGQYADCFEKSYALLRSGGLMLADNMTSHADKLEEFTRNILSDTRFDTLILPIGTGLLYARKK